MRLKFTLRMKFGALSVVPEEKKTGFWWKCTVDLQRCRVKDTGSEVLVVNMSYLYSFLVPMKDLSFMGTEHQFGNTFRSQRGQELSPVRLAADIMGVSRKHSSVLSSIVPPRPRSRSSVSQPASESRSVMEVDASWLPPAG